MVVNWASFVGHRSASRTGTEMRIFQTAVPFGARLVPGGAFLHQAVFGLRDVCLYPWDTIISPPSQSRRTWYLRAHAGGSKLDTYKLARVARRYYPASGTPLFLCETSDGEVGTYSSANLILSNLFEDGLYSALNPARPRSQIITGVEYQRAGRYSSAATA